MHMATQRMHGKRQKQGAGWLDRNVWFEQGVGKWWRSCWHCRDGAPAAAVVVVMAADTAVVAAAAAVVVLVPVFE